MPRGAAAILEAALFGARAVGPDARDRPANPRSRDGPHQRGTARLAVLRQAPLKVRRSVGKAEVMARVTEWPLEVQEIARQLERRLGD